MLVQEHQTWREYQTFAQRDTRALKALPYLHEQVLRYESGSSWVGPRNVTLVVHREREGMFSTFERLVAGSTENRLESRPIEEAHSLQSRTHAPRTHYRTQSQPQLRSTSHAVDSGSEMMNTHGGGRRGWRGGV